MELQTKNRDVTRGVAKGSRWLLGDIRQALRDIEFRGLLFFASILLALGTVFYMIIEDWDVIEAFYFSVATLTTVGYGDLHPTSDFSRLFTAFYALSGVGFILTMVTVAARLATKPVAQRLHNRERSRSEEE